VCVVWSVQCYLTLELELIPVAVVLNFNITAFDYIGVSRGRRIERTCAQISVLHVVGIGPAAGAGNMAEASAGLQLMQHDSFFQVWAFAFL